MSTNFSSSWNLSLHPPASSPNSSSHPVYNCLRADAGFQGTLFLICVYFLLFLPLSVFIVHLGLQRWRMQNAAHAPMDVFTYNCIVIEVIGILGCCFYVFSDTPQMMSVGFYFSNIVPPGQMLLHTLTCLERYIAVVHPVVYLSLRKATVVTNGSIVLVWFASLGWVAIVALYSPAFPTIPYAIFMALSLIIISFFSFFVLYTLIQPGPGKRGGDRERVDQSKRRAVYTITVITGVLLLRLVGQMVCNMIAVMEVLSDRESCIAIMSGAFFCLPSSYILPLLFLHRAGKLPCFTQR